MAHIAHTGWFDALDVRINGISVGGFGQLDLCAGCVGVPSIFGAGDLALTLEAAALDPGIEAAAENGGLTPNSGDELDTGAGRARSPAAVHMSELDHRGELRCQVEDLVRVLHLSEA